MLLGRNSTMEPWRTQRASAEDLRRVTASTDATRSRNGKKDASSDALRWADALARHHDSRLTIITDYHDPDAGGRSDQPRLRSSSSPKWPTIHFEVMISFCRAPGIRV